MPLKDFSYWVDANLPPKTIGWLHYHFGVTAKHVYEMIGLLASDEAFYLAAKEEGSELFLQRILILSSCNSDLVLHRRLSW